MKTRLTLVVLLLLTFALTACQPQGSPVPQDPMEAVKAIAEKQKEVKTQHMDMTLGLQLKLDGLSGDAAQGAAMFKNFKGGVTLSGDVDSAKEDFALKGDLDLGPLTALLSGGEDKIAFEAVKVGEKMYTKANVGDTANKWNEQDTPKATADVTKTNPLDPAMVMGLLKQASKAEKLADEKIGDTDTYHYKVTLDPVTLLDQISSLAALSGNGGEVDKAQMDEAKKALKGSTLEVDLWAGKSDLLLRQVKVHFNMNMTDIPDQPGASALIDLTLQDTLSKINQPVTITAPK
jgi:hypothetical protein